MDESYRNFTAIWNRLTNAQRMTLYYRAVLRYGSLLERIGAFWKLIIRR